MYSLRKISSRGGMIGQPLPDPFRAFATNKIQFRYGGTSMIAGAPGCFKSVIALNLLSKWETMGLDSLYFSADSDEMTVWKRMAGIRTGDSVDLIEDTYINGNPAKYNLAQPEYSRFVYSQL